MEALKARLTSCSASCSPSHRWRAINYALNHWDGLTLFLDDGRVEVDTNTVERSMRPDCDGKTEFIVQRQRGRRRELAILASLVNTAKLHELDPQAYRPMCWSALSPGEPEPSVARAAAWNWKAARARSLQAAA